MHRTLFAAAVVTLLAGPALAHARLESAKPGIGATVAAPTSIVLDFNEGIVPAYSGVTLADAAGKPIKLGPPAAGATPKSLVVPIGGTLAAGTYSVSWHAVSVDTHRTKGSFRFTVAP